MWDGFALCHCQAVLSEALINLNVAVVSQLEAVRQLVAPALAMCL